MKEQKETATPGEEREKLREPEESSSYLNSLDFKFIFPALDTGQV